MLSKRLGMPHLSTGDMLRTRVRQGAESDRAMAATMSRGSLVSDEVVNQMVENRLSVPDAAAGFILDGYPRTVDQAAHLSEWFVRSGICELVIYLAVDYNVVIARLSGRRQCPRCGTLYNLLSCPPREDERCDLDGEKLVVRDDDREEVIRERLGAYERQTRPVLEYFKSAGRKVVEVDASYDPPEVISRKICQAMEENDCSKNSR